MENNDFTQQFDPNDIEQNKVLSLFSYLGILFLIPLLAASNSQYARFHANQGLVLFIVDIVAGIVMGVIATILTLVAGFVGITVAGIIDGLIGLCLFIFIILGIVNAVTGKAKELPVIGKIRILK